MARHIDGLKIESYRGIKNLRLNDLGDINILVGGNNSGKTSILEAIQILSRPLDFNNIVKVARQRDRYRVSATQFALSRYNSFLNIFSSPKVKDGKLSISLGCSLRGVTYYMYLDGEIKKALLSVDDMAYIMKNNRRDEIADEEVDTYIGTITVDNTRELFQAATPSRFSVALNKYARISSSNNTPISFSCEFLSTIDHIVAERFRTIISNKELTEKVVSLLQKSFDENIVDLRILEDEDGRTYQAIDHKQLGYVPLSTFGDGIKKVIAMASAAALIQDGILLIDEYETAIHPSAMSTVFKFLIDICQKRNIQLFLTTHNIEAIEKLLDCSDDLHSIRVITMQKNTEKTLARVLDGQKALIAKNELGLELR